MISAVTIDDGRKRLPAPCACQPKLRHANRATFELDIHMNSTSVLFVGDAGWPEFRQVHHWLSEEVQLTTIADLAAAVDAIERDGLVPQLIVLAERWPGELSPDALNCLRRSAPLRASANCWAVGATGRVARAISLRERCGSIGTSGLLACFPSLRGRWAASVHYGACRPRRPTRNGCSLLVHRHGRRLTAGCSRFGRPARSPLRVWPLPLRAKDFQRSGFMARGRRTSPESGRQSGSPHPPPSARRLNWSSGERSRAMARSWRSSAFRGPRIAIGCWRPALRSSFRSRFGSMIFSGHCAGFSMVIAAKYDRVLNSSRADANNDPAEPSPLD